MARDPKIDAGIEAVPSPQWVKDEPNANSARRPAADSHSSIEPSPSRGPLKRDNSCCELLALKRIVADPDGLESIERLFKLSG
jgi:hypothetical protein